jgi:hypothetical protein
MLGDIFRNPKIINKKKENLTLNRYGRYNSIKSDFETYLPKHPKGYFRKVGGIWKQFRRPKEQLSYYYTKG